VAQHIFGRTKDGYDVTAYRLENGLGASAVILDYGCTVQSLCMPNARGTFTDVVLGYDTVSAYEENSGYVGAVIGRVANRIGKSEFTLNGKTCRLARNDGDNHLHGGLRGFDKMIWKAAAAGQNELVLTRLSPDGEENYPGNLEVKITYILTGDNELRIMYDAAADVDTIVNLTNHSYFNLNGGGSVLGHELQIFAGQLTENDPDCLPTGKLLSVSDSPFDFRNPKPLGRDIQAPDSQLRYGSGYDHNYVLTNGKGTLLMTRAAVLHSTDTGIRMTILTTQPGMQLYSGNHLTPRKGKNGTLIDKHGGVCLETQVWPNAMAYAHFPSPILRAGNRYHTETVYHFDVTEKK
jgi:aldose 1-epimerase